MSGARRRLRSDRRALISGVLAVAAVACLFLGNTALWMRQDVYSGRNIDREAQQIIGSPNVQVAVADLLTTKVIRPVLSQMGLMTPFISHSAEAMFQRALAAPSAQQLATRLVEQVVPELEKGAGPITLSPDQLAWIASPGAAANPLVAAVLRAADTSGCCRVVLAQRQHLSFIWRHVGQIRTAGIVLPAMFAVFVVLSVSITRLRRRLGMILAASTAVTGLLTLAFLWAGPWWAGFTAHPSAVAGIVRAADGAVFGQATASLWAHSLVVAVVGLGALALLAGAGRIRSESRGTGPAGERSRLRGEAAPG